MAPIATSFPSSHMDQNEMSASFSLSMSNACALPRPVSARAPRTCLSSRSRTSGCSRPPGRTSGKSSFLPVGLQVSLRLGPRLATGKRGWGPHLTTVQEDSDRGGQQWHARPPAFLLEGAWPARVPICPPEWAFLQISGGARTPGRATSFSREQSASATAGAFGRHRPGMACFNHGTDLGGRNVPNAAPKS